MSSESTETPRLVSVMNGGVCAGSLIGLGHLRPRPSLPSDNHSWFLWAWEHVGPPIIRYASKHEAEANITPAVMNAGAHEAAL
jgi:hypothetical protein